MEIIHIVLGKANPNRMNGVNKVVYQLATKQAEFGQKVAIWGITKDTEKNFDERNFSTRLFIKSTNPFCIPKKLKSAMIEKKGTAVFHIHGGWIPVFYAIGKMLHGHKIPYVFTPHGAYNVIAMKKNYWIKKLYFELFEKKILKYSSKIHCIGKSEMVALRDLFRSKKTVLSPYGFENSSKIVLEKSKNDSVIFGFIGRLDIYTKGLDTLLKALKKHLIQHPNSQLWIVGGSREKAKLNKLIIEMKLQNNVVLFGGKFGKDKEDLLNSMDIFVHPSRNEGLPTSVIEAASYGKPCIVTDATNIGDLILKHQAGEIIYYQNSTKLSNAMNKLAITWNNQDNFLAIRNNAIDMVQENFNWKKVITEFNDKLYKS